MENQTYYFFKRDSHRSKLHFMHSEHFSRKEMEDALLGYAEGQDDNHVWYTDEMYAVDLEDGAEPSKIYEGEGVYSRYEGGFFDVICVRGDTRYEHDGYYYYFKTADELTKEELELVNES